MANGAAQWTGTIRSLSPRANPSFFRDWSSLSRTARPFLRPEFFALERPLIEGGESIVAAAQRDGELAGVLPLVRRGRSLEGLLSPHAPRYDYVGDPEALPSLWRTLLAEPGWDRLVLSSVPAGSPLTTLLPTVALRDLCVAALHPGPRSPYFALPGFEARLSTKLRQNLRRWARKAGTVELERLTAYSRSGLDEGLSIEAAAWKGAVGSSIAARPELRHFYSALARLAARRGELALYYLRAEGKRIAFLFALEDDREVYALKVGYDPAFAEVSPGNLLFAEVARSAEGRGLLELDFMGRDDEWKRRWTSLTHDHVTVVVYRASARGAAALLAQELIKPRLPQGWQRTAARARLELETRLRPCQRRDLLGEHAPLVRLRTRLRNGLGVRSGARRLLAPPTDPRGAASAFAAGQWVRVRDASEIRATLDRDDKLRGLLFMPAQWGTCGQALRVSKVIRRMVDDCGELRRVSRTVLLDGATCDHPGREIGPAGCGRRCALMYRDEWLEPVPAPVMEEAPTPAGERTYARVRPLDEIRGTLSADGRRDGLSFLSEMRRFAGVRLPILRRLRQVFECDDWVPPRAAIYELDGAICTGRGLDRDYPCDRACTLLWHADWLTFDPPPVR
jgi:hypothetical protein